MPAIRVRYRIRNKRNFHRCCSAFTANRKVRGIEMELRRSLAGLTVSLVLLGAAPALAQQNAAALVGPLDHDTGTEAPASDGWNSARPKATCASQAAARSDGLMAAVPIDDNLEIGVGRFLVPELARPRTHMETDRQPTAVRSARPRHRRHRLQLRSSLACSPPTPGTARKMRAPQMIGCRSQFGPSTRLWIWRWSFSIVCAAGAHAQEREDGMDEAGEGADRQLQADARGDAHMLEIGLADLAGVSGKGIACHLAPASLPPAPLAGRTAMIQTQSKACGRFSRARADRNGPPAAVAATPAILDLGERQRGAAEAAFGRDPADIPVGAAAAGAVIDLVAPVDGVVAPLGGIVRESLPASCGPWIATFRGSFLDRRRQKQAIAIRTEP